jgi:hypothetical protein
MGLSEKEFQEMLRDPHCLEFIEAIASILVHLAQQRDQVVRLKRKTEETPAKLRPELDVT